MDFSTYMYSLLVPPAAEHQNLSLLVHQVAALPEHVTKLNAVVHVIVKDASKFTDRLCRCYKKQHNVAHTSVPMLYRDSTGMIGRQQRHQLVFKS